MIRTRVCPHCVRVECTWLPCGWHGYRRTGDRWPCPWCHTTGAALRTDPVHHRSWIRCPRRVRTP